MGSQLLLMRARGNEEKSGYQGLLIRRLGLVQQYNSIITRITFRVETGVDLFGSGRVMAENFNEYMAEWDEVRRLQIEIAKAEEKARTEAILKAAGVDINQMRRNG